MTPFAMHSALALFAIIFIAFGVATKDANAQKTCDNPLYLTLDTGHMDIAVFVSDVLKRQQVRVTFFAANERTKTGDGSLGDYWAPWWYARAAEGHEFASHTWNHTYWRADIGSLEKPAFRVQPTAGFKEGQVFSMSAAQYCDEIRRASDRLQVVTGKVPLALFRAPGGKTSPRFLASNKACGFTHVGWSPAGFLGDELPSESASNEKLLRQALHTIRSGDILLAHLGIWSRKDPWAPAVLEPLIVGLKQKGFCFRTLREHPAYFKQVTR